MRIDRAFVVVAVLPADESFLEPCLEHLVAAADEAAAAGIPTTVVLSCALAADRVGPVLTSWSPLVSLLEGVEVVPVTVPAGSDAPGAHRAGLDEAVRRTVDPATTLLLTTAASVAVGVEWITEHARHHADGARATTGPVKGGPAVHPTTSNLAVRMDVVVSAGLRDEAWRGDLPLVHAVTPVVGTLRVTLRTAP